METTQLYTLSLHDALPILHGNIPTFISITSGKVHDVNILDEILPEAGAFYVMDRGYIDFERLYVFTLSAAFFVVRTDRKSTRLNSSHANISYAVFCLKKKK